LAEVPIVITTSRARKSQGSTTTVGLKESYGENKENSWTYGWLWKIRIGKY
jgi:hypothetical protein